MKSDYPVYFNEVVKKLISKEFQESFISSDIASALEKILTYVRSTFDLLQTEGSPINIDDLAYSAEATRDISRNFGRLSRFC